MNQRLHNTTQSFDPWLRERHSHYVHNATMIDGRTGTGKTELLAVLAKMKNISVKELVQRFKLS